MTGTPEMVNLRNAYEITSRFWPRDAACELLYRNQISTGIHRRQHVSRAGYLWLSEDCADRAFLGTRSSGVPD